MPAKNLIGIGSIEDLPIELIAHKLNKALIVTDKNIISCGYVEMVETSTTSMNGECNTSDNFFHQKEDNRNKKGRKHI